MVAAAHRPVGLAEPLERVGEGLGDEGEEQADEEDEAGDHLEEPDRPFGRVAVVVQAGGVEHVQDRRPERLAEVAELPEGVVGDRGAAEQDKRDHRDPSSVSAAAAWSPSAVSACWKTDGRAGRALDQVAARGGTARAGSARRSASRTCFFQASTIGALLEGAYEGDLSFAELAEHGDLGLGTLNGLDGEMIAIDGRFYRADVDGKVGEVDAETRTPFAVVTSFEPTIDVARSTGRSSTRSCWPGSTS